MPVGGLGALESPTRSLTGRLQVQARRGSECSLGHQGPGAKKGETLPWRGAGPAGLREEAAMPSRGRAGAGWGTGLRTGGLGPRGSGLVCDREDPHGVCRQSVVVRERSGQGNSLDPTGGP